MGRMILALVLTLLPMSHATATTRVVYPDGSGSYATVQSAINASSSGDTVELADGVFLGDGNRDINFGGRLLTVRSQSGDREACIIDCEGTDEDTHRGFIFDSGEGPGAVVRDLTISGAFVNGC